jgi:hypothetical protein
MELILRRDGVGLCADNLLENDLIEKWSKCQARIKDSHPNPPIKWDTGNFERKGIRILFE